MPGKTKSSASAPASAIIHRTFYAGHPDRLARLEKARQQVSLGDQIRRAREEANMTQAQLAEIIDSSPSAISRLEDADPEGYWEGYSVRTLRKIADAVHMQLSIRFEPIIAQ